MLIGNAVSLADAAKARTGVQFRAAAYKAPDARVLGAGAALLRLDEPQVLRYVDSRRQCNRTLKLVRNVNEGLNEAVWQAFCCVVMQALLNQWLGDVLKAELSTEPYGRMLLASGAKAPSVAPPRTRQRCVHA